VSRYLDELAESFCLPKEIVLDNGPEGTSRAMFDWSERTGVWLRFIEPGKPVRPITRKATESTMLAVSDLAPKLRLTAAVLGCSTGKELCARFRAINTDTPCDLDRLYKWLQGRASPRSAQLYNDWAQVLGLGRSGIWIAACTLSAFEIEIAARSGCDIEDLRRQALGQRSAAGGAPHAMAGKRCFLSGAFACYSHAFSPYFQGRLTRGALRIEPGRGSALNVSYHGRVLGSRLVFKGAGVVRSGVLLVHLIEQAADLSMSVLIVVPGPPAQALCGILAAPAFVAHDALASATRFLAVRVTDGVALDDSARYLDADSAEISQDLQLLGFSARVAEHLGRTADRFLARSIDQVSPSPLAPFCAVLDPLELT
jgi:hypothetical protein